MYMCLWHVFCVEGSYSRIAALCITFSGFILQVAVCNLASLALNMYVTSERTYDFKKLADVTKVIVRNLNKIIDINFYPIPEVRLFPDLYVPAPVSVTCV